MPPRRGRARRLHRSSAAPRGGQVPVLPASHPRHLGRSYQVMKMHMSTWWRRRRLRAVLIMVTALLLIDCTSARSGETPKVRPAGVAGSFYPADPKALATMVDGFLAKAAPPPITGVVALVSPHAGYEYAGQVAAYSYALLKGRKFDRVVVIAPSHHEAFGFASIYDGTAYSTPLGQVPVDRDFAAKLVKLSPLIDRKSTRLNSSHLVIS